MSEVENTPRDTRRFTGREVGAFFLVLIGLAVLGSALLVNPWVSKMTGGATAIDRADVTMGYFVWALAIAATVFVLARTFARTPKFDGVVLVGMLVLGVVLADRLLLAKLGLPMWRFDPDVHYAHRADTARTVYPQRDGALYYFNAHGHHDDDFPVEKPRGELRGAILGDSVTMGFGVTKDETYANRVEQILGGVDRRSSSHQMMNLGVHGYSTSQERVVLERSLDFQPDFISIGFCLNDVTEPVILEEELGGYDYHEVVKSSNVLAGWLTNETGFGRLHARLAARGRTLDEERLAEVDRIREMALASTTDPRFEKSWSHVFTNLERVYEIGREQDTPVVLLVFPFTFQLLGDDALRAPQRALAAHAKKHGVDVIDFTPIFRDAIFDDPGLLGDLRARGYDDDAIAAFFTRRVEEYFYDADHPTPIGHELVARHLVAWMAARGLVELPSNAGALPVALANRY